MHTKVKQYIKRIADEFGDANVSYDQEEKYITVIRGNAKMHLRLEHFDGEPIEEESVDTFIRMLNNGEKTVKTSVQED